MKIYSQYTFDDVFYLVKRNANMEPVKCDKCDDVKHDGFTCDKCSGSGRYTKYTPGIFRYCMKSFTLHEYDKNKLEYTISWVATGPLETDCQYNRPNDVISFRDLPEYLFTDVEKAKEYRDYLAEEE